MRNITTAAQYVQLLLYRVQLQDDAVKKVAADRLAAAQNPMDHKTGEEVANETKWRVEMYRRVSTCEPNRRNCSNSTSGSIAWNNRWRIPLPPQQLNMAPLLFADGIYDSLTAVAQNRGSGHAITYVVLVRKPGEP